uniref:Uncharacterized protein n=1 Tax=Heterorhabditis bacteriophora TaxID=37862 RepID=A0A1I7WR41_HETBA
MTNNINGQTINDKSNEISIKIIIIIRRKIKLDTYLYIIESLILESSPCSFGPGSAELLLLRGDFTIDGRAGWLAPFAPAGPSGYIDPLLRYLSSQLRSVVKVTTMHRKDDILHASLHL